MEGQCKVPNNNRSTIWWPFKTIAYSYKRKWKSTFFFLRLKMFKLYKICFTHADAEALVSYH